MSLKIINNGGDIMIKDNWKVILDFFKRFISLLFSKINLFIMLNNALKTIITYLFININTPYITDTRRCYNIFHFKKYHSFNNIYYFNNIHYNILDTTFL